MTSINAINYSVSFTKWVVDEVARGDFTSYSLNDILNIDFSLFVLPV